MLITLFDLLLTFPLILLIRVDVASQLIWQRLYIRDAQITTTVPDKSDKLFVYVTILWLCRSVLVCLISL